MAFSYSGFNTHRRELTFIVPACFRLAFALGNTEQTSHVFDNIRIRSPFIFNLQWCDGNGRQKRLQWIHR